MLVTAACAQNEPADDQEPTETETVTTAPAENEPEPTETNDEQDSATDAEEDLEDEFNAEQQESAGWPEALETSEDPMYLTEIRVAQHEDFEREVFEHSGNGVLAFWGEYVEEAIAEGLGTEIEVAGEAILRVGVGGVAPDPDNPGAANEVEGWSAPDDTYGVVEVLPDSPFEAHAQYFIGLDSARVFHIHAANDLARIHR